MGKFSDALGVWELKLDNVEFELKPTMGDVRKFRAILLNDANRKDKNTLYDKFADLIYSMIKIQYAEEPDDEIKMFIEVNVNSIFEDAMIRFKWTSKEELDKSKNEALGQLKKLTEDG